LVARKKKSELYELFSELFCIAKASREEGVVESGESWVEEWHSVACFLLSASHHVNYRIWLSSGPQYLLSLSRMGTTCQWEEKKIVFVCSQGEINIFKAISK